ncbi:hypothetical protein OJ996_23570 [Luteolibacter sp. GHJ8]|uniref:Uncharacterized protein n=1 Tax=Luteolibacter rhizosphaerae TaxID=2989719 RepID=A0ABT3G9R5_9BACT|nr:hypothetical protein [Luteolibacter rhizosphaerae]MCW1916587.1 hypothetical protein [Luteolibacter rhizosphaerae]
MKCLTDSEVSVWLQPRGIAEDPYARGVAPEHYLQFLVPLKYSRIESFIGCYCRQLIPESELLIQVTDWAHYTPEQMLIVDGIRALHREQRCLIDAPGHWIAPDEMPVALALFTHCTAAAWSAYLYSPQDRTTLHIWEGELFDFWSDSAEKHAAMRALLREFKLEETSSTKPES